MDGGSGVTRVDGDRAQRTNSGAPELAACHSSLRQLDSKVCYAIGEAR